MKQQWGSFRDSVTTFSVFCENCFAFHLSNICILKNFSQNLLRDTCTIPVTLEHMTITLYTHAFIYTQTQNGRLLSKVGRGNTHICHCQCTDRVYV